MSRKNAREAAMRLFYQRDMSEETGIDEYCLGEMYSEFKLSDKDLEYIRALLDKSDANSTSIDKYIMRFSRDWTFDRLAKVDLAILRVAICEMLFLTDIPHSVSINEAVELSKKYSDGKAGSFINGILASILHDLEQNSEVDRYKS
jgi:N utilization substance protein B